MKNIVNLKFPLCIILLFVITTICRAQHGHTHDEPAYHKYSREANEAAQHAHSHSHTDDNLHAHSHNDPQHAHSHGAGDSSHGHGGHGHSHKAKSEAPITKWEAPFEFMNDETIALWVYGIGSTILISIAPYIILFFIPVQSASPEHEPLLKVLLAFASGGLLGDAFLHLIPHALMAKDDGHSHSHSHTAGEAHEPHDLSIGLWVLAGIGTFLCVEKLVRIAKGDEGHSYSHLPPKKAKESDVDETDDDKKPKKKKSNASSKSETLEEKPRNMAVAGYLNLAADFAHNFTDGLAVGASYLAGNTIGVVTTITVLLHEVPHEIGDFAILVQSGCSKKKAMALQLVTAFGAILGCFIALHSADPDKIAQAAAASWVLPFTAGGFIYIATVSVIPELLEDSSLWQSIKEVIALLVGIFMMVIIAQYE